MGLAFYVLKNDTPVRAKVPDGGTDVLSERNSSLLLRKQRVIFIFVHVKLVRLGGIYYYYYYYYYLLTYLFT
jgi:hypothetical protein